MAREGGTGYERPVKGELLGKVVQLKREKAGHKHLAVRRRPFLEKGSREGKGTKGCKGALPGEG